MKPHCNISGFMRFYDAISFDSFVYLLDSGWKQIERQAV
ncbi:hypothetical protein SeseC_00546 [Streptococcus equi subsp. zooepidemicus ATCC 35246]|nr:hypothetical protein SeseC_00546 [Streptococcus equi subsp. zooepidemicus ATCC 35246]AIA68864.1 hypothetical protein Q426_07005 [Streptococcus equi subsp. zooepidemicus CY]